MKSYQPELYTGLVKNDKSTPDVEDEIRITLNIHKDNLNLYTKTLYLFFNRRVAASLMLKIKIKPIIMRGVRTGLYHLNYI